MCRTSNPGRCMLAGRVRLDVGREEAVERRSPKLRAAATLAVALQIAARDRGAHTARRHAEVERGLVDGQPWIGAGELIGALALEQRAHGAELLDDELERRLGHATTLSAAVQRRRL